MLARRAPATLQGATRGGDSIDAYVIITKVVSEEAKNMNSWIEWIVLADLPISVHSQ